MEVSTTTDEAQSLAAADLLTTLARALHQAGLPAHKLEETLLLTAERLGVALQVFSLPTGAIMSFEDLPRQRTRMARMPPGQVNLERLAQLSAVAEEVIRGDLQPNAARQRIEEIVAMPPRWSTLATVLAYVLSAAAFTVFFGGDRPEVFVGSCVGLAVGLVSLLLPPEQTRGRVFELIAAIAATVVAGTADWLVGSIVEWAPLAAGLVILLPGIALVDAIEELAHGHLASGSARLAGVFVILLALTFGTVLGMKLGELLPGAPAAREPQPVSAVAWGAALALVSIGSMIRFRARPKDLLAIFVASTIALVVSRVGVEYTGDYAGPFLGALALGLVANLYARLFAGPAELFLIPGLALLVPGSMGLRSMGALLTQDTSAGIDTAFRMFIVAMALVAGLLFSSALARDRIRA